MRLRKREFDAIEDKRIRRTLEWRFCLAGGWLDCLSKCVLFIPFLLQDLGRKLINEMKQLIDSGGQQGADFVHVALGHSGGTRTTPGESGAGRTSDVSFL